MMVEHATAPFRLHVHAPLRKGDVGDGAAESGRRVPLVGVLDVHVDLRMKRSANTDIAHALRPLEGGVNNGPVVAVAVDHVLDLLQVRLDDGRRPSERRGDVNLLLLRHGDNVLRGSPPRPLHRLELTAKRSSNNGNQVLVHLLVLLDQVLDPVDRLLLRCTLAKL